MTYIFSLSQEHPHIPRAEVEHVLEAEDIGYDDVEERGSLLFVDVDTIQPEQVGRLAMTYEVAELLHEFPPDAYQKLAARDPVTTDQSFAVRKMQIDDTAAPDELERNVGRIIDKASDGNVDLDSPDTVFRIYLHDDTAYLCRIVATNDRSAYEARKNQFRPYSSPVSIHPRLARAAVNLSTVSRDGTVLDPFCGTGGILLEAGLIGCDVYGLDMQEDMVDGSRENLDAFRVDGDIRHGEFADVGSVFDDVLPVDAVVTDLPYGKASKVDGDPTADFADTAAELTDGSVVFMSDQDDIGGLEPRFEIFVHRSLTRYVYVLD